MTVAGVDLGATNIMVALVGADHEVHDRVRVPTPVDGPDAVVEAIVTAVRDLDEPPTALGVGAPGLVRDGIVDNATNLARWDAPVPLARLLTDALGLPVVIDNDATAGAVGEWVAGAGVGADGLLGVWLGTGVGGGLVLEGRPYRGAFGGAGELGHVVVAKGGAVCGCGRRGCVEAYAGRACLERLVKEAVGAGERTELPQIMAQRGKRRLTAAVWARALEREDPLALRLIAEAVEMLGVAIGSVINLLDLHTIVIGGGLAEKLGQALVDRIAAATRPWLMLPDPPRRFLVAALGDDAGVVGTAALAREAAGQAGV